MAKRLFLFGLSFLFLSVSVLYGQQQGENARRLSFSNFYAFGVNKFHAVNEISSPDYHAPLFEAGGRFQYSLNEYFTFSGGLYFGVKLKGRSHIIGPQNFTYQTNLRIIDEVNASRNKLYIGLPISVIYTFQNMRFNLESGIELRKWNPTKDKVDVLSNFMEFGGFFSLKHTLPANNNLSLKYFHSIIPFFTGIVPPDIVVDPSKPLKYYNHSLVLGFEFSLFKLNEN